MHSSVQRPRRLRPQRVAAAVNRQHGGASAFSVPPERRQANCWRGSRNTLPGLSMFHQPRSRVLRRGQRCEDPRRTQSAAAPPSASASMYSGFMALKAAAVSRVAFQSAGPPRPSDGGDGRAMPFRRIFFPHLHGRRPRCEAFHLFQNRIAGFKAHMACSVAS